MVEGEAGFHKNAKEAHTRQSGPNDGKSECQRRSHQPPIHCPECTSRKVWKDGVRSTRYGDVQRYICRSCGYRFSESKVKFNVTSKLAEVPNPRPNLLDRGVVAVELSLQKPGYDPPLSRGEDVGSHKVTTVGENLNSLGSYNRNRRVCVSEAGTKNLSHQRTRMKQAAGATLKPLEADKKGKIVEFMWWMKKQGLKKSTIMPRVSIMRRLMREGVNLWDSEEVKKFIAEGDWGDGYKANVVDAYSCFLEMEGLGWTPPRYKRPQKFPFIPLESEVDQLIAGCGKTVATFLQGLKETGADPGELWRVEWTDINEVNRNIRISHPVKGHNPRIISVSGKWLGMVNRLPKDSERVFASSPKSYYRNFANQRRRIASKLETPRLMKITFTTLRHFKGTMEYHRTKDILHVKKVLGHKDITNTMIYINLEAAIFEVGANDAFIVKVAHDVEETCKLVEVGFEYVTGEYHDGGKIFRKRK